MLLGVREGATTPPCHMPCVAGCRRLPRVLVVAPPHVQWQQPGADPPSRVAVAVKVMDVSEDDASCFERVYNEVRRVRGELR